jgi:uncharacterized protein
MLTLNLPAVARGEVRVEGEISPEDPLWDGLELELREPLAVALTARSVGEGVLLRGTIRTRLELQCRRCLKSVPWRLEENVDLLYEPLDESDEPALAGEVYPLPSRGGELDLGPALREQLVLSVPEFVVCRKECRGLCPQCGADLNQGDCSCVPAAAESPWGALKKLKFD